MSDTTRDRKSSVTKHLNKLLVLAVLVGIILLTQLPNFLIRTVYIKNYKSTDDWMVFVVLPATSLVLMVGSVVVLISLTPKLAAFECTWFRRSRREFVAFLLLPLGIVASVLIVRFLAYRFGLPRTEAAVRFETGSYVCYYTPLWVWLIIRVSLLSPVVEEVFWRGYAQSALMRICHPALALLGQAAIFGLIHFRPLLGFLQVFLFGLIFGIWCYRRKTLLPVIVMHVAFNSCMLASTWCDLNEARQIKIAHNYVAEFIRLSKPANYDPNEDAREDYAKASRAVKRLPKALQEVRKRYPTEWSREERSQANAWITSNRRALDLVEEGAQKPYYWVKYRRQNERMPPLAQGLDKVKDLVLALCMRAAFRAAEGRYGEGLGDIETCYGLSQHLEVNKGMQPRLLGWMCQAYTLQTLRQILAHEKIDGTLLADLQGRFGQLIEDNDVGLDFSEDRLFAKDMIQCIFTDDGQGGGHLPRSAFRMMRFQKGKYETLVSFLSFGAESEAKLLKSLDRHTVTLEVDLYYDLAERASQLSCWQYREDVEGVRTTMEHIRERNPLLKTYSPGVEKLVGIAGRARVDRDATITILAILRYKDDTERLPVTLSELVDEGYLQAIPQDSFSDGPLVYKQTADGFLLYSFGVDLDDDEGTPSKWGEGEQGGDQVFWPVQTLYEYAD